MSLRLAITADLHWGHGPLGDQATRELAQFLYQQPPDLLILAGDIGTREHFAECLALFADLPCPKGLVPGNHDIWVGEDDPRGNSLMVYEQLLPALSAEHGFLYLDQEPLLLKGSDLAIVGSMNWYDYSWSLERLKTELPDWQYHLRTKSFSRGRHNDGRFVRWPLDDAGFTRRAVETLAGHLKTALGQTAQAIVVTHHPAFFGLSFPRAEQPATIDGLLWDAFSGNTLLEEVLQGHPGRIPLAFSGHTHRSRENSLGPIHGYNIGGDYHFKRLLMVDWPEGKVHQETFGDPNQRK